MKIELLKNKQTSIIEKIVINKGIKHCLSDIPFNLTHNQTMIDLDAFDLTWHEMIMEYNVTKNILDLRSKLYKDFDNRELDYLINVLERTHKKHFYNVATKNNYDAWFFNYYIWTLFFLVSKNLRKINKGKTKIKVVDPTILLYADGINILKEYEVFHDFKKAKELFDVIWYHNFSGSIENLHRTFSRNQYNNEKINLEIFKSELLKRSELDNANWIHWLARKRMIKELIIDLIKEKLHYSA